MLSFFLSLLEDFALVFVESPRLVNAGGETDVDDQCLVNPQMIYYFNFSMYR